MTSVGRVLITADDANVSEVIDEAIYELVEIGVVTNVAAIANADLVFEKDRCSARDASVSVHLNITYGFPSSIGENPSTIANEKGELRSPKNLLGPSCRDLGQAISSFRSTILPQLNSNEIGSELQSQVARFVDHYGALPAYNSFHQDFDIDERIFGIVENDNMLPPTRQHLLKAFKISGFKYQLFDEVTPLQNCIDAVEKLLFHAIETSAKCGGIPFEIALHPATSSSGLDDFTAYQSQRVLEYDAWRSDRIVSLVRSGRREGALVSFDYDVEWSGL